MESISKGSSRKSTFKDISNCVLDHCYKVWLIQIKIILKIKNHLKFIF